MKFYLTTRAIPQLRDLSLTERMAKLQQASSKLTVPEKTLLNLLKLLIIVPVFIIALRTAEDWSALLYVVPVLLLYPLLVKPIQYSLCVKYLEQDK